MVLHILSWKLSLVKREVAKSDYIVNKHNREDRSTYNKCTHGLLTKRDKMEIQWVNVGTPAYFALE